MRKIYRPIFSAASFATALVAQNDDARLATVDNLLDQLQALRRQIVVTKNAKATVAADTRTFTTPTKANLYADFDGTTGSGNNGIGTANPTDAAKTFYNAVTAVG